MRKEVWTEVFEQHEPECRFVVLMGTEPEHEQKKLQNWCFENSTELIQLKGPLEQSTFQGETVTRRRSSNEKDDQESEGIERIADALSCVAWDEMSLALASGSKPTHQLPKSPNELAVRTREKHGSEAVATTSRSGERGVDFMKGDVVLITGLKSKPQYNGQKGQIVGYIEAKDRYSVRLRSGAKLNIKSPNLRSETSSSELARSDRSVDNLMSEMLGEDAMDRIVREIKRNREAAGSLPDHERRQRAEETILKFVSMLEEEEKMLEEN
eukprot:CAMPEP_0184503542 /NCGR_PEP_ID=MMETSP0113_2-20130426/51953_1 /TAXON_ID=91329 /ORGANISM="Norrisiella sphaerica, Strain BC52" /LENGTH=268 /DNA_ID=CAMNT_0026893061 /DNA_START=548 /DNA_END=1354 /DNA_ORIENTATION=-